MDKLPDDEDEDDEDEDEDEEPENNKEFEDWVKEHKQTFDNKFEYILASDVKDEALKDYIISLGYEYKTKILNGTINKRGYKLMKQ